MWGLEEALTALGFHGLVYWSDLGGDPCGRGWCKAKTWPAWWSASACGPGINKGPGNQWNLRCLDLFFKHCLFLLLSKETNLIRLKGQMKCLFLTVVAAPSACFICLPASIYAGFVAVGISFSRVWKGARAAGQGCWTWPS